MAEIFKYTHIHTQTMATKNISISVEAYERLKMMKEERESFTDVINRMTGKRSLLQLAGFLNDREAIQIKEHVKKLREDADKRIEMTREKLKCKHGYKKTSS